MQKAKAPTYQACNISALQGCEDGRQGHGGCGGGGRGGPNACILGLVPQEEVDKVTTVENRWHPSSKYSKFTPPKKAKHYQLKNAGKIPGTGPCRKTNKTNKSSVTVSKLTTASSAVSMAALAISELTVATTKRTTAEDGGTNDDDQIAATNSIWGQNRDKPAIAGYQGSMPKKQKISPTEHSTLSAFHMTQLAIDPRRYITDLSTKVNPFGETTPELDSHAETCVLSHDAFIFLDYERPVVVKGYDPFLGTKTYATVALRPTPLLVEALLMMTLRLARYIT